ncbi:MAG TPA: hypothetical protein VK525_20680 [Candidatus Saccharimonadales bacterium]|nr:hypothetical protein [Candidatus Saccharimonadales bacterium]
MRPQVLVMLFFLLDPFRPVSAQQPESPASASQPPQPFLTVPPGTRVILSVTSPIWAKSAKIGDTVYAVSVFPVPVDGQMAIPTGTYVQGKIDALTRPTWRTNRAEFQIHFTKLIFSNGYTVLLSDRPWSSANPAQRSTNSAAPQEPLANADIMAAAVPARATATVFVQVGSQNDLLLDNGAQFEMALQTPLFLNSKSAALAARTATPPQLTPYKSSTHCVPTPGTPGTSATIIPGTPGFPGTPDTVIPGTSGSPGIACPGPPIVVSSPNAAGAPAGSTTHSKSISTTRNYLVSGNALPRGTYQISWTEPGPDTTVEFIGHGQSLFRVPAKIIVTGTKARMDELSERSSADGTITLQSLRWTGESTELDLDIKNPPGSEEATVAPAKPVQE